MRGIIIATVLLTVVAATFILGVLSQTTGLMLAGFCLGPVMLIGWGYTLGRAGLTVQVGTSTNGGTARRRPRVEEF